METKQVIENNNIKEIKSVKFFSDLPSAASSFRNESNKNYLDVDRPQRNKKFKSRKQQSKISNNLNKIASSNAKPIKMLRAIRNNPALLVLFASFVANMIIEGSFSSYGVVYNALVEDFNTTRANAAWVGSVFQATPSIFGPLSSLLNLRYGYRKASMIGAVIASVGCLLGSFARSVCALIITFGLITGFGLSLVAIPSLVIVAFHFKKRRSFASSLAVAGSGLGVFIYAPLVDYLIKNYSWTGAFRVMAGLYLQLIFCGACFILPRQDFDIEERIAGDIKQRLSEDSLDYKKRNNRDVQSSQSNSSEPQASNRLENDDEVAFSQQVDYKNCKASKQGHKTCLTQNLNENQSHFRYQHLDGKLSSYPDFNQNRLHHKLNNHESIKIINSTELGLDKTYIAAFNNNSNVTKTMDHELENNANNNNDHPVDNQPPNEIIKQTTVSIESDTSESLDRSRSSGHSVLSFAGPRRYNLIQLIQTSSRDLFSDSLKAFHLKTHPTISSDQSEVYYKKFNSVQLTSEEDMLKRVGISRGTQTNFKNNQIIDFSILKNRFFVILCIQSCMVFFAYDIPILNIAGFAQTKGISSHDAALLISIFGVFNCMGQIGLGWMADTKLVDNVWLYNVTTIMAGLSTIAVGQSTSLSAILSYCIFYGLLISSNYALSTAIFVEHVGIENLTNAFGISSLAEGVALLLGPPLGGYLFDVTGNFQNTFTVSGVIIAISGIILFLAPIFD